MALDVQTAASDRRLDGRVDLKRRLKKYVDISARVDVMPGLQLLRLSKWMRASINQFQATLFYRHDLCNLSSSG